MEALYYGKDVAYFMKTIRRNKEDMLPPNEESVKKSNQRNIRWLAGAQYAFPPIDHHSLTRLLYPQFD